MDSMESKQSDSRALANLAKGAKSAAHISRAALASGLYGAAATALEESLPLLLKIVGCILLALVLVPIVVFVSLPHVFFGYASSETAEVTRMTALAMSIGELCLSETEFEDRVIDPIVTEIVEEYTAMGIAISGVDLENNFDENSLCWLIAINSVAHQQNLEEITVEDIHSLCDAKIQRSSSLFGEENVILRVTIQALNAEDWMEQMDFDTDAENWAAALYQTLKDSNALEQYGAYYSESPPNYGGDSGYGGSVEYGSGRSTEIDLSGFRNPAVKSGHDLAAFAVQAWENGWGYVWGTFGHILTPALLEYKVQQYPDGVGNYQSFIRSHWLGGRTVDCIGLIKSYCWLETEPVRISYASHGVPDYDANSMYHNAVRQGAEHGAIVTIPEIPGLILWKQGHTGVYIGGGFVIEAMGTSRGVVKTELQGRGWQAWYKLPYLIYD